MVGVGLCCCGTDVGPFPPCEETCCEPYPDELGLYFQYSETEVLGIDCDDCPSTTPFQVILAKDADPTYEELPGAAVCDMTNMSGCYADSLFAACFDTVCVSATYSASFSTGCLCCTAEGIDPFCYRNDYDIRALYVKGTNEYMEEPGECTIVFEVYKTTWIGPDCDNLQICGFTKTGYIVTNNAGGACSCGFYDYISFGGAGPVLGGGCADCGDYLPGYALCGASLAIATIPNPEWGKLEVIC